MEDRTKLEKLINEELYFPYRGLYQKHGFICRPSTREEFDYVYKRFISAYDNKDLQGVFNYALMMIPDNIDGLEE